MRYVVTGGAGFIGSHLVKHLHRNGHRVTVVDNLSRGTVSSIENVRDKIEFVNLDIADYDGLRNALRGTDGIFHQAALASVPDSFEYEDDYWRSNVVGTDNVFKIGHELRVKTVFASSSSVYGNTKTVPIKETSSRNPLSPYAMTKYEDEKLAEKYVLGGAQIIALRYFNVVGTGRSMKYAGAVPKILDAVKRGEPPCIFGDGTVIRDFVHVSDVTRANIMAMESTITYGFFNIGSGVAISIKDLAHMIVRIAGKHLEPKYDSPRPGDADASVADVSKAKEYLRWEPSILLEDGIRTML